MHQLNLFLQCADGTKRKKFVQIDQPATIATYNSFMGGVDLFNYLTELYRFALKSRRWYMYLFYHSIMVATVNAWLLYRRHCLQLKEKHANLCHFKASVAESLIAAGKRPVGRPSLSQQPATKKHKAAVKPPKNDVRLDGVGHMPMWSGSRLRCKSCPWQKHSFSFAYCVECKVYLCFNKDRNCFAAYHQ